MGPEAAKQEATLNGVRGDMRDNFTLTQAIIQKLGVMIDHFDGPSPSGDAKEARPPSSGLVQEMDSIARDTRHNLQRIEEMAGHLIRRCGISQPPTLAGGRAIERESRF